MEDNKPTHPPLEVNDFSEDLGNRNGVNAPALSKRKIYDDLALLSVSEAARLLHIRKTRIYSLINEQKLRVIDLDGTIRIQYLELGKCLERLSSFAVSVKQGTSERYARSADPKQIIKKIRKERKHE